MASILTLAVVFLFILTYTLVVIFYRQKTYIVWSAIIILLFLGVLTPFQALMAIDWNIMGIYIGMLFVCETFIYSRAPHRLAEKIASKSPKVWMALLGLCIFSGFISIFAENVAVVLIVAPIAMVIAKKFDINPVPIVIGVAISSNLQGVATMIGDPPSLLVAHYANLKFNDFFFFQGRPGLFFAVQLASIASLFVLYLFFRKYKEAPAKVEEEKVLTHVPEIALIALVAALIISSFFDYTGSFGILLFLNHYKVGVLCMAVGLALVAWYYKKEKDDFFPLLKRLDSGTALFLAGIFIIVAALVQIGFVQTFAEFISRLTGNSLFMAFAVIVSASVLFSAFIDNVPFIAAMLPVVSHLADFMSVSPYVLYFGLVIGASVGGNITPIGASANIVAVGFLKNKGYRTSFMDFVKIGLPFTIVSVLVAVSFIWLMFGA
jgi:Na+/H+ antiporter NhaD/arsenite permease-like protein